MTATNSTANIAIANQAGGRQPKLFRTPVDPTSSTPPSTADFYSLTQGPDGTSGVLVAQVRIACRVDPWKRTAYVQVTTPDYSATDYDITIGGTSMSTPYDASATPATTVAELVTEWAAAINGDANVGSLVTATAVDYSGGGTKDAVRIQGATTADYTFNASVTSGTAVLALYADAVSADVAVYVRSIVGTQGNAPGNYASSVANGYALAVDTSGNGALYAVGSRNLAPLIDVRGMQDMLVDVESITGVVGDGGSVNHTVARHVYPAVAESSTS